MIQALYSKYVTALGELGRTPADLVFVDGNGVWHPRGVGLASYFGVRSNVRSIGVAKNVLVLPGSTLSLSLSLSGQGSVADYLCGTTLIVFK